LDNKTIGVIVFLIGIVSFLQSFKLAETQQTIYFTIGLILIIGGLFYTRKK